MTGRARGDVTSYAVKVSSDLPWRCELETIDGQLMKVHFAVHLVPSEKRFTIRHLTDATAEERRKAEHWAQELPYGLWDAVCAPRSWECRNTVSGCTFRRAVIGRPVEDPLVQLELEMMIDLDSEVMA